MKIKFKSLYIILALASATASARITDEEMQEPIGAVPGYEKPGYQQMPPMPGGYPDEKGSMPMPGQEGLRPPSPEEFAQWYQEVNKEVDQFKSTLSVDERKQFDTEVENLTKVMTDILETEGPEGLDKFIDSLFQAEAPMPEAPAPAEEMPTPPAEVETKEPEKKKEPEVPGKSIDAAAKLVEDLIFYTERFLRKSEIILELPGKIERWVEAGKIKEWKADVTWETLKARIQTLNKRFHDLQDRDPKSKQYKYLSHLAQDESLYNNMSHLLAQLSKHEPDAEAPAYGQSVRGKPKKAIQEVLSSFMEAIYKLEMIQTIEKLIEKYEPRAKELREEEETGRKRAHEESKKPRIEAPKRETEGVIPYGAGGATYGAGAGAEYGYPTGGFGGGYPAGGYYEPSYPYTPTGGYEFGGEEKGGTPSGKPGAGEGKAGAPGGKEAGKPGAKGKGEEKAEGAKAEVKPDPAIQRLIGKFDTALDDTIKKITDTKLGSIESHMLDGSQVDADLAALTISTVIRKLNSLIEQVKVIKTKATRISKAQLDQALAEIRGIASAHKGTIMSLHKQIMSVKSRLPSIAPDKQYAYFGGKSRDKASNDIKSKIPTPDSLEDIATALDKFNSEVGPYGSEAEAAEPSKAVARPVVVPAMPAAPAMQAAPEEEEEEVPAAAAAPERTNITRAIGKFDTALEKAALVIEETAKLKDIKTHIATAAQPVDSAVIEAIKNSIKEFTDALKKLEELRKNITALPAAEQKRYTEQFAPILQEYMPLIDSMIKQWQDINAPAFKASIPAKKLYAYMGGELKAGANAAALAKEFPQPASLKDLIELLNTLKSGEPAAKRGAARP